MHDRVQLQISDHVAHVRLNRPDKLNALDIAMFQAIEAAGDQLAADADVRAVVLSGEGPSFCSGLDFMSFVQSGEVGQKTLLGERTGPANLAQRASWVWKELPVPVIAALHGHVYGGGVQIAMGADIRIATEDARLSVLEIKWGLIPDMGITRTMMGVIRADHLAELTYTGKVVSGVDAVAMGLVTRTAEDPLAEALELARLIASKNPDAIRANKRLFQEAPALSTHDAFELETELQKGILSSPNQMEAVMANLQKRAPVFSEN